MGRESHAITTQYHAGVQWGMQAGARWRATVAAAVSVRARTTAVGPALLTLGGLVAAPVGADLQSSITPAHSVEVGGFANDPHTRGQASDTPGIEGVPEATLRRFGLSRPFPGAAEADHIQLA